ncbi:MAG: GGDEF domain-containing protein [Candidatus Riflebacteria bacterium]|nr:GGDEF domain-containing protein [Candidatus Riflebacteria bacterium]
MKKQLCRAIHHLALQQNATFTIQQMLHTIGAVVNCSYAILVLRNESTGYLEIKNFCNMYCETVRNFKRKVGTGVVGRLFFKDRFIMVSPHDPADDYNEMVLERPYATAVFIRVESQSAPVGYLGIYFDREVEIDSETREFLIATAEVASVALEKEYLRKLVNELKRFDHETGLLCHTFFLQKLGEELSKSERYRLPLTLAIMDLDNYKDVMNLHGLTAAHALFVELADQVKACVRGVDVVGLFGTDEFIVYMPNTPVDKGETVLARFRDEVLSRKFTTQEVSSSLSIGMTGRLNGDNLERFIWRAQTALHNARLRGKGLLQVVPPL